MATTLNGDKCHSKGKTECGPSPFHLELSHVTSAPKPHWHVQHKPDTYPILLNVSLEPARFSSPLFTVTSTSSFSPSLGFCSSHHQIALISPVLLSPQLLSPLQSEVFCLSHSLQSLQPLEWAPAQKKISEHL